MSDGNSTSTELQETPLAGPPKARRRAVLAVLVALFGASVACIVVMFETAIEVEETQAVQAIATRSRAVRRLARVRAAAPVVAESASAASGPTAIPNAAAANASAGHARPSSRHAGGRPDLATPQGGKLYEDLLAAARSEPDAKKRSGAVRSLAGMYRTNASDALSGIADDPAQPAEVRDVAAKSSRRNAEGGK